MYLKKTPNQNGRIRLSIVDTYYDKAKKCSRQKTIESIDWLDKLEKQYDDPIAHFQKRVEQQKAEKQVDEKQVVFWSEKYAKRAKSCADKSRQYCCI